MRTKWIGLGALLLLMLMLAACGAAVPAGTDATEEPLLDATPTPEGVAPSGGTISKELIEQRIVEYVATERGVSEAEVQIVHRELVEWPTSALGCPQPGQMYSDVITPGYDVEVQTNSETIVVHTNVDAGSIVLCTNEGSMPLNPTEEPADTTTPSIEEQVKQVVASESGVDVSAVTIVKQETQEWRTSALGCPEPGTGYLDVITPGYQFTVEAAGETFDVRSDQTGQAIKLCKSMEETEMDDNSGEQTMGGLEGQPAIVQEAASYLAQQTGLAIADLTLQSAREVEWSDSSLGCPDPATMYMQVITPGSQIVFESGGETFYVHTNADGSTMVLCENPQAPAPGTDQ